MKYARIHHAAFNKDNRRILRDLRRLRLQAKTVKFGLLFWLILAVFCIWAVAETVIDPPLNLTGEEAMREAGR